VPETRRVALEEMDTLFGGVNHVEKGGASMGIEDSHHAHAGAEKAALGGEHRENNDEVEEVITPAQPVKAPSVSKV